MNPWHELFSQVEKTYVHIARLLKDVDGMVSTRGFSPNEKGGNAVGTQGSANLDQPAWWFPGWVCRSYFPTQGDYPRPLAQVSVLLYTRRNDQMRQLEEPVVSAARWDFHERTGSWRHWMGKAWGWGACPAFGEIVERPVQGHGVNATGRVFAVPLESITCPDDLDRLVITPLVGLFKGD